MKKLLKKIVAVGLSAAMMLSSAVTAFAEEEADPTLKLSATTLKLEEGATSGNTITATVTGSATLTAESENADIASVAVSDKTITITPKKAGVIDIDVAYGKAEATLELTVTEKAKSYVAPKFYSDSAKSTEITKKETGLYENGGKVAEEGKTEKVDYKNVTIYTNATLAKVDPNVEDAKVEEKEGKLYVAVTKKDATAAPVSEGKVTKDADAAKILKASLGKDGAIKLTAVGAGTAKVWIMDIGANKKLLNSAAIEVTVLEASANVAIGEIKESKFETVKSATVVPEKAYTFTVKGLKKDKTTEVASGAFAVEVDSKSKSLIKEAKVETKDGTTTLSITANKLTSAKAAKAKVTVYDTHSGKKSAITVNIVDTVKSVKSVPAATDLSIEKKSAELALTITTTGGSEATTDKAKVYVVAKDKKPYKDTKGKISVKEVSRKDLAAKLDKTGKLTLTAKDNYSTCDVYVAYTDAASKTTQIVLVATVRDGVLAGVTGSAAEALAAKPTTGGGTAQS